MSDAFQNDPLDRAQKVYSPLPQMVQRFQSMFAGGRPAPVAPPDLEQQDQQEQQAGPPDPSRMPEWNEPRRQTLALPPGAPTPRRAPFQPFMPASLPRPPHQWGQEERFPQLPQPFEVPHLMKGLSGYFAQNGSQSVAAMAMAMGPYAGQFLEGVQKGQHERAQQAKEQLAIRAAKMTERAVEEQTAYSDIFAEYGALAGTSDPKAFTRPIKGVGFIDAIGNKAAELGDSTLHDLIGAGAKPSDVQKFLEARDNRIRDLQKTKTAIEDNTVEDARWGLTPAAKGGGGDDNSYSGLRYPGEAAPAVASAAPVDPTTGKPAPVGAPAAKLPGDKVAGPGAPADKTDAGPEETPVDSIATSVVRGVEPSTEMAKMFPRAAREGTLRGAQQITDLENLERNPPKDPAAIMSAIKKVNPSVASDVQSVLDYKMPASGGTSGTGASPGTKAGQYSDRLRNLAQLVDPKWNQGFYQDQQRFRTDVGTQNTLARTKDLAAMADRLNTDLRAVELDLKKRGMNTSSVNMDAIVRNLAGDPKYVPLHTDFLAYNDAYNTIVSGGRHTQGGAREQTDAIPTWAPLSTYRNVIKGHMSGVDGMIEAKQSQWRSIGGKDDNMPSGDDRPSAEAFQAIKDYKLMDYVTGARPMKDVVIHNGVRTVWTGKNQVDRDSPENWMAAD
jgi:hypothetical protein